jgi:hypothetical protein
MLPGLFTNSSMPQQLHCQDDEAENKKKKTNAVNPVHISHPFGFRLIGIGLAQVKVLGYLFEHSHENDLCR